MNILRKRRLRLFPTLAVIGTPVDRARCRRTVAIRVGGMDKKEEVSVRLVDGDPSAVQPRADVLFGLPSSFLPSVLRRTFYASPGPTFVATTVPSIATTTFGMRSPSKIVSFSRTGLPRKGSSGPSAVLLSAASGIPGNAEQQENGGRDRVVLSHRDSSRILANRLLEPFPGQQSEPTARTIFSLTDRRGGVKVAAFREGSHCRESSGRGVARIGKG